MDSRDPMQEGQEAMLGGDYFVAQDIFLGLLRDDPHDGNALYHLGLCHIAGEDWAAAESALRRCLEVNPKHTDALIELGEVQLACDRPEEAMLSFSLATTLAPENSRAWVAVARMHEMLEMDQEAVENYEKAMMLADPADAPSYELALAYARTGRLLRADLILDGLIGETLRQGTQNFATDLAPGTRDDLLDYLGEMKRDRDEIRAAYAEEHGFPIDTARWLYQARLSAQDLEPAHQAAILAEIGMLCLIGADLDGTGAIYRLQSLEGHFCGRQLVCLRFVLRLLIAGPTASGPGGDTDTPREILEAWPEVESVFG